MKTESLPYVSLLSILFGTTLVASRFAVGQFAPLTYVALRLVLGTLCYLGVYAFSRERRFPRDRRVWRHAPVLGILGTAVPMSLIVLSLLYLSSGVSALLLTLGPAMTAIIAHIFLHDEALKRRTAVGILLAMSGAALLAGLGETGLPDVRSASPVGYSLVVLALISSAGSLVYARHTLSDLDPIDVASVRVGSAMVVMLPLSLLVAGFDLNAVTRSGYAVLGYAGLVGTFLAMLLEVVVIQRFGATATAMTANLIPGVALISGALFLGEEVTPGMLAAMVLILAGISLVTRRTVTLETVPAD